MVRYYSLRLHAQKKPVNITGLFLFLKPTMTLNDYKNYLTLSYDRFITEHNIHESQIVKNVSYEKITQLNRIQLGDNQYFFFNDGELKIVYLSDNALIKKLWAEFKNTPNANAPETIVRSRAGKTSNQLIFSEQGITASVDGDTVEFIEIYPPQPLHDYLTNIYREPGPFIR
jgi:hypothetical protein